MKGFSTIEVILAAALFVIFTAGITGVVIQGVSMNRLGVEHVVATQFASEGLEAARSIKNQSYGSLVGVNPTLRGIVQTGGVWGFLGDNTQNTLPHNITDNYVRTVKVESVNRDGTPPEGNIVSVGGTTDVDTRKITSEVTWNFSSSRPESISIISYLTDWKKPISSGGPIMMAYSKATNTPFYRTWDGSSWSSEGSGLTVGGPIKYIVLKSSDSRNEAVLATLNTSGEIYAQVWDGNAWGNRIQVATVGTILSDYRGFDIEYEQSDNRAVIVYLPDSTSADPSYRIWNGSSWSSATTITAPPTTGVVRWIELAPNPTNSSNEIAMIMLDANSAVYGMSWNGSTWGNMGVASVWDSSAASANKKAIDVAYEQNSARAMFIWADATATDQYYRIWNGSLLTSPALLNIGAAAGIGEWVRLVSRPNSDELLYGVQDASSDLNTRKWSGTGWDTVTQHPEHDAVVENTSSMNFDLVWETHTSNPGKAWIMWGDGATVSKKQWSATSWGSASVLTGSDDTSFVKLKADPSSGAIFAGIYEDSTSATDDIWESRLTGGGTTWSAKNTIWGGATSATPVFFRIDISTP